MSKSTMNPVRGIASMFWVAVVVACNDDGSQSSSDDSGGVMSAGSAESGSSSAESGTDDVAVDTDPDAIVEIRIDPPSAMIDVFDGTVPDPTAFTAVGITQSGEEVEVGGVWDVDRIEVGSIDGFSGEFRATGAVGGVSTVRFEGIDGAAEAEVTVKLHFGHDPESVDPTVKDAFDDATMPDPSLALLYPYDGTVFPRGLSGPTMQWSGANPTDVYRIRIDSPVFEYQGWGTAPTAQHALPELPADVWRTLTESVAGSEVTVEVQRHDGTQAYLPKTQTWKIADADLIGVIYYWEVNNGNVVRLKPGDPGPEAFIQKPAGVGCVACHSVSADGSTIVASFHGGDSPWGTFQAGDGASLYAGGPPSGFQAVSPEGDYVVWGQSNAFASAADPYLALSPSNDATVLASLLTTGGYPAFPAWSPDGTKLAYNVRTDGNWLDFTQSSLWVADVDTVTPGFANQLQIAVNDATRPTLVFPTWSPDSQWIAFGRATQARTRGAAGELWLTDPTGATQLALGNACGVGHLAPEQQSLCYEPTFMPEERGGYFWLVFVSERQYGNTLVDTVMETRRKQLWVTAIDADPQPGQDPSHPAFWLPGQELDNQNMRGAWALEAPDAAG